MEAIEKLRRARIQIQQDNPFFAYLSLYLKFREAKKGELPEEAGAGVDARGNFIYNKEFIDKISDKELKGVVIHEILHLSFLHLMRLGPRNRLGWNVACDIIVNHIIKMNGFSLPEGCLITDYQNTIEVFGQKIKDVDKKSPEIIYDEFKEKKGKGKGKGPGKGKGGDEVSPGGFDYHDYSDEEGKGKDGKKKDKDGKNGGDGVLTDEEKRELEKEWKQRLTEAYVSAQQAGKLPAGIERLIGKVHQAELDWRTILLREVQAVIPYDFSWAKPHKKSCSTGWYMPDLTKELINIVVGVDVSGSIGKKEYTDFLSEIIGMARAYRGRITIRFLTHDVSVHNDYVVENGNVEKIKELKVNGGGGTSHEPILDYIAEKVPSAKLAVFLTDGYSDLQNIDLEKYRFRKVFVIQSNGTEDCIKDKNRNKVFKLRGNYEEEDGQ